LSERSEFSQTTAAPSNAAYPRYARGETNPARLFSLPFFGDAKKGTAQSDAHPDTADNYFVPSSSLMSEAIAGAPLPYRVYKRNRPCVS
jgi:hypothetical protein